jgi:MFS family permease
MGFRENASPLTQRPTRTRYIFLVFAGALSLVLYLDRICISKSAEYIEKELDLDKFLMGLVFSAFTAGYTLFEVPSGAWGDRFGPKRVLTRIVLWWSLFTVLTGCVWRFRHDSGLRLPLPLIRYELPLVLNGFLVLLVVRFLFGVGEAGAYPNLAKCSSRWFPLQERGLAQGVVATAGRLGGGIAAGVTVAVTGLVNRYLWPGMGWRATFWLFGLLGLVWMFFFARWFRNTPAEHPAVNAAELELITRHGAGAPPADPAGHAAGAPWRRMLRSGNLWAYSAAAFCSAFVVYLYFTHFPAYLRERHHVSGDAWAWAAGLPMILGAVGCTLGGLLTDWLVRRTGSRRWGRRIMGLAGKGGGAVLLLAGASVNEPILAVALISLSAFCSDLALAAHWAVSTDCGGRFVGSVFGFMNMVAGLGAWLSPVAIGGLLEVMSPTVDQQFDAAARAHAWDLVLYVLAASLALYALLWLRVDAEASMVD